MRASNDVATYKFFCNKCKKDIDRITKNEAAMAIDVWCHGETQLFRDSDLLDHRLSTGKFGIDCFEDEPVFFKPKEIPIDFPFNLKERKNETTATRHPFH